MKSAWRLGCEMIHISRAQPHPSTSNRMNIILKFRCNKSRQLELALKLVDPFQRKHWPKWWPTTELMRTGIFVHTEHRLIIVDDYRNLSTKKLFDLHINKP